MSFISGFFFLFLAVVCFVAYITPPRARYAWLLVCSYAFYLYRPDGTLQNLPALLLLIAVTACGYLLSFGITKPKSTPAKRFFLALSLLLPIGVFVAFKAIPATTQWFESLSALFIGSTNATGTISVSVTLLLPLGLAFYLLQAISYSIDLYKGRVGVEHNPLRYALHIGFFPNLVAGPINRAADMLPQYRNPALFDYSRLSGGLFRILWGLCKKMIIADTIASFTFEIFSAPEKFDGPVLVFCAILFAYQLYADFSGCCDIAIGAAYMMGFTFSENFHRPFSAKTFSCLWKCWFISLVSFFEDYLSELFSFFSKKNQAPADENGDSPATKKTIPPIIGTLLAFLLIGFWHGPKPGYVLWAGISGILFVLSASLQEKKELLVSKIPIYRTKVVRGIAQRIITYLIFSICLIFFASSLYSFSPLAYFGNIHHGWKSLFIQFSVFQKTIGNHSFPLSSLFILMVSIPFVSVIEKFAVSENSTLAQWIRSRYYYVRWLLYYGLIIALLLLAVLPSSPFIYLNI